MAACGVKSFRFRPTKPSKKFALPAAILTLAGAAFLNYMMLSYLLGLCLILVKTKICFELAVMHIRRIAMRKFIRVLIINTLVFTIFACCVFS